MADRYPLIFDSGDNKFKELPTGDNLNLQGNSIINASSISSTGFITGKRRFPVYNNTVTETNVTLTSSNLNNVLLLRTNVTRTVNLPPTTGLQVGDWIKIVDVGSSDTNRGNSYKQNITIVPNGARIQGDPDSLIIDIDGYSITLMWCGSAYNWRIKD